MHIAVLFLVSFVLIACATRADSFAEVAPQQKSSVAVAMRASKLFSHTPGYNYGPSVIAEGTRRQVWWCGYGQVPGSVLATDVIYYRTIDTLTGTMSPIQMVFWPEIGSWDGRYTCDPSVIKGNFQYDGSTYGYALYYTATDLIEGNNRIGVAFSNDGVHWARYAQNPIISPQVIGTATYGAGQAATYRDNAGNIVLFHTDTSANGVFVRTSADGINFGPPILLSNNGAAPYGNSDFAYESLGDEVYAAIALPGRPGDRETYAFAVYRIPADQVTSGHWEKLATIDTAVTGSYLNHSPGLVRNGFGALDPTQVETYFTEGSNDPNTWTLYSITFLPPH